MPIDSARLEELHIVRKVRETVRRWWGVELSFTDARGRVVDHGKGIIIPPNNRICTACLGDKEGLKECNRSIEEAVQRLHAEDASAGSSGQARMLGPCHMGIDVVAAPIAFGGERQGTLFACGFLVKETAERAREPALAGVRRLSLPVLKPDEAFNSIARVDGREVPRLTDLMATTVSEVADVEEAVLERERKIIELRRELDGRFRFADIIGKSAPMQRLYQLLDKVVQSEVTVLVTGENGTGKELVARAIHHNGPRKDQAFVAQNCAALNDNLLESELFGHMKGAFTGAARDKTGLFRVADGGTFFLDEVGDMSPAMQVKLLRVLQEGTFVPVGGTKPEKVDVRIVAATNKDLRELVARRQFREDLFYRLHVLSIEVPALRDRIDDLPLLVEHFLARWAEKHGGQAKRLSPKVLAALYERSWPGNVRELENEIERLAVLAGEAEVIDEALLDHRPREANGNGAGRAEALLVQGLHGGLQGAVEALEKELISRGLRETNGNRSQLAQRLGVSRTTLLKKIRDYKLGDGKDE
ncbi:MAG: sigma 54-interacting transcriptional regulator [Deltaproteobacteria bacterium]|nr:sigma 54-interacting transcriptional regulator [Deltaproteobacteria bacterium]